MPSFGKRVDGPEGRRRNIRQTVVLAASAVTLDRSRSVLVEDVCAQGAKLRGCDLPGSGAQILFRIGNDQVMASVAWRSRDECGITFDEPLNDAGIRRIEREANWGTMMGLI
jgi:hypothetical protein